ncbi:MAG: 50S ribosomal protein L22 [Candidatus Doudnabacteria bacterium]|nr:50S ribosomal protein L22 [Candidatus Doudnabacteria bacterium]
MTEVLKQSDSKLVRASARDLHVSPRKIRLVTNLIKGMNANDALVQLLHTEKKAAPMVAKLVKSAIANAKNNFSLSTDHLFIKSITADMGKVMKRYFPRARGSAFVIRRKMSHVNLVLEERKTGKASKSRMDLFNKQKKDKAELSVDARQESNIKPESETPKKSQIFRSDEQVKMSKAQNKRRLFNRKSGE